MGGVASRRALLRVVERRELDAALRRGDIVRDARGRYALPIADAARRADGESHRVLSRELYEHHVHGWGLRRSRARPGSCWSAARCCSGACGGREAGPGVGMGRFTTEARRGIIFKILCVSVPPW